MADQKLSEDVIQTKLQGSSWTREQDQIVRELEFGDFDAAVEAVMKVAAVAQSANHHPDLLIHDYNKLKITLSTHSAGGLTTADFDVAAQVDIVLSGPQEAG